MTDLLKGLEMHKTTNLIDCSKFSYIYTFIVLGLYPFILYFRMNMIENVTKILIPVFVSFVFVNVVQINYKRKGPRFFILYFAFFAICTGDYIINLTQFIELSIVPFTLAHILFSIFYFLECKYDGKDLLLLIPVSLFSGSFFILNYELIETTALVFVFSFYLVILSIMLWRSFCYNIRKINPYKKLFISLGSLFFYITDLFVCKTRIDKTDKYIVWIWVFYPVALFLLSTFEWFTLQKSERFTLEPSSNNNYENTNA